MALEISALGQPFDRFRRSVLTLINLDDATRKLGASIRDGRPQGVLPGLCGGCPAVAAALKDHANLAMDTLSSEARVHHIADDQRYEEDGDPNGLLHAKKFPILRNLE